MVEEQYVTFETAKLAKEKGFDETTLYGYSNKGANLHAICGSNFNRCDISISRPTQSLLARWLRENNLHIEIDYSDTCGVKGFIVYLNDIQNSRYLNFDVIPYDTYEEAMEDGLQEALKFILCAVKPTSL